MLFWQVNVHQWLNLHTFYKAVINKLPLLFIVSKVSSVFIQSFNRLALNQTKQYLMNIIYWQQTTKMNMKNHFKMGNNTHLFTVHLYLLQHTLLLFKEDFIIQFCLCFVYIRLSNCFLLTEPSLSQTSVWLANFLLDISQSKVASEYCLFFIGCICFVYSFFHLINANITCIFHSSGVKNCNACFSINN